MPVEDIEYRISVSGTGESVGDLEQIGRAIKANTSASADSVALTKQADSATQSATQGLSKYGGALGQVGQAVGRLNPVAGQMVSVLGQATGVVQNLASSGLGPLGIAVGVAAAAFSIISAAIDHFSEENERAAREIRQNTIPALRELQSLISAVQTARDTSALAASVRAGSGTEVQQQGYLSEVQEAGRALRARLRAAQDARAEADDESAAREQADRELRSVSEQIERNVAAEGEARRFHIAAWNREHPPAPNEIGPGIITEAQRLNLVTPDSILNPREGRGGGGGTAQEDPRVGESRRINSLLEKQLEYQNRIEEAERRQLVLLRSKSAAMQEIQENKEWEALEREKARATEEDEARREQERNLQDKANASADREAAARQEEIADKMQKVADIAGGLGEAFTNAIGSSEGFGKALVASIDSYLLTLAKQETVKAIVELAEGFASLAIGDPKGVAGHFQAAGLHAAAAAAAGAASAAIPNAAPSGGGGVAGARPERDSRGGSEQGSTTIINFGGDVITAATYAEVGRQIRSALNAGDARLGRG